MPEKEYEKRINNDALARLLRRGAALPDKHAGMLLASLANYMLYGYVDTPGYGRDFGIDERLPYEAKLTFSDFLIENDEDIDDVESRISTEWAEMTKRHEDKTSDTRMAMSEM